MNHYWVGKANFELLAQKKDSLRLFSGIIQVDSVYPTDSIDQK